MYTVPTPSLASPTRQDEGIRTEFLLPSLQPELGPAVHPVPQPAVGILQIDFDALGLRVGIFGHRNAVNLPFKLLARQGIDFDKRFVAHVGIGNIPVGNFHDHPHHVGPRDRVDRAGRGIVAGADEMSHVVVPLRHDAVVRRANFGEFIKHLGMGEFGLRHRDLGVGFFQIRTGLRNLCIRRHGLGFLGEHVGFGRRQACLGGAAIDLPSHPPVSHPPLFAGKDPGSADIACWCSSTSPRPASRRLPPRRWPHRRPSSALGPF